MRSLLILMLILLTTAEVKAQRRPKGFALRFEGAHLDLSTALLWGTASANIDVSYFRSNEMLLGVKPLAFTHGATNSFEGKDGGYVQYGAGILALISHRTEDIHVDLGVGPAYFFLGSERAEGWDIHGNFDIRVMLADKTCALLFHVSTSSGGVGLAIGWMRH